MGYRWPKRPKYNVVKEEFFQGGPTGSKLEKAVYGILKLRERAGEISDIKCQCSIDLGTETVENARTGKIRTRTIRWKVDFSFWSILKREWVWCEAKGLESALYRRQLKLYREGAGPGPLEIWKGDYRRPRMVDFIVPFK